MYGGWILTVGRLKEFLKNCPDDDQPILVFENNQRHNVKTLHNVTYINYAPEQYFDGFIYWPDFLIKNQPQRKFYPGILLD